MELSRRLGVNRSTVTRDMVRLEDCGLSIIEDENGLISLIERSTMTVSDYLVCGMKLPPLEQSPVPVPEHTRCALEGTLMRFWICSMGLPFWGKGGRLAWARSTSGW